jgi:hypothetical protein
MEQIVGNARGDMNVPLYHCATVPHNRSGERRRSLIGFDWYNDAALDSSNYLFFDLYFFLLIFLFIFPSLFSFFSHFHSPVPFHSHLSVFFSCYREKHPIPIYMYIYGWSLSPRVIQKWSDVASSLLFIYYYFFFFSLIAKERLDLADWPSFFFWKIIFYNLTLRISLFMKWYKYK